jgi:urea transport system permease protein
MTLLRVLLVFLLLPLPAAAQDLGPLQAALQAHREDVERASRRTVDGVIEGLGTTGLPYLPDFLQAWRDRGVVVREVDGLFYYGSSNGEEYVLTDVDTGAEVRVGRREAKELRPNAGVRRVIATALVRFQLSDPDRGTRARALNALARDPGPDLLAPLRESIPDEPDAALAARKRELERQLTARFGDTAGERIAAIAALADGLSIDRRATLSQILDTRRVVAPEGEVPPGANLARRLAPGDDLAEDEAYALLVQEDLAPPPVAAAQRDDALVAAIEDGAVAGIPVADLDSEAARWQAYAALAARGDAPPRPSDAERTAALERHAILDIYTEPDPAITDAARAAADEVGARVARAQALDLGLDGLSLASIYFLAAVGLAITFGVMGVINMAHGEFIMMGAYTGYVVQQIVPGYTASLIVALPLAFVVGATAGVLLERLVIRHLLHRPLETLLATFGISIALQQIAKNVFGTQARPLTSPDWLAGAWTLNDVVSVSWIRVAIFVLALFFFALIVLILRRTRLGLEVRAVTQNPGMAASLGIDPDRIGMLTFGLGSGIAGVAGVAIGLYAQVTSEMGAAYIVQSFMTVVVGGVGSVFGTLAGAGLIGGLQKGIEWLNPSNTLAAQTYMILFVILFIQFRPRGLVVQRGRAAGD